ncbi:thioredoxin-like domain-containing protein [Novispirillum sp. DQ9]|uniref:thioredoxin-like domain-containing protein n=1 Tax=Novispirillum sp. DQ9 TaxID=3398612 RepID=UPI003C7E6433
MFGLTRAPALDRPGLTWFNVDQPLGLAALRGRIVILDFWTFCCINCHHVIPTLRAVEEAFPDEVAVIGVHSPKFPAERDAMAVRQAIARHGVRHAVVHDPDMTLWDAYCVKAWPTLVLLSPQGHVIGQLSGEPNPERLLQGIAEMVRTFRDQGDLTPAPLPLAPLDTPSGRLRFPGKIKALPRTYGGPWKAARWAVADAGHHQVVLLSDDGDEVARVGTGSPGLADGPPARAAFREPQGLAATAEAIYVADTANHALRRIDRERGTVATVAGTGERGLSLRGVRGARATALASPWDVEVVGALVAFANAGTHQIGAYDHDLRTVWPLAGTGAEALVDGPADRAVLAQPSGLCLDADGGALYFVDSETSAVRRLTLGGRRVVETVVGTGLFDFGDDDGPLAEARLQHPLGLACFGRGLVVADSYNGRLRYIDLPGRMVHTIADPMIACGHPGCGDAFGTLAEPAGVTVAGPDRLMVSDTNHHRILEYRLDIGHARPWYE